MLVFTTAHSQYAIDPGLGMLMQFPGGTPCGLRSGVWHAVVYDTQPRTGEPFYCSVRPRDGGRPVMIRTSPVTWLGPEPPLAARVEIAAAS